MNASSSVDAAAPVARRAVTVGIVVLSWNRCERVLACIGRLERIAGATIIVVDNASDDDSVVEIRARYPSVVLVEEEINRGFVGGVNRGMQEALRLGLSHAWLLNDDTDIDDTTLPSLVDYVDAHPECHLFSPVIRDSHAPHDLQCANGIIDWRLGVVHQSLPEEAFDRLLAHGGTPVLIGTALLVDLGVLAKVPGFDPRYFAYWEDIDFCVRCAHAGFVSRVVDTVTVLHDSPPRATRAPYYAYYGIRNEALFWSRFAHRDAPGWRRSWLARALVFLGELRDHGQPASARAAGDAIWDGLRRREGARDATRPAPAWFVRVLAARPYLLTLLIRGEYRLILDKVLPVQRS